MAESTATPTGTWTSASAGDRWTFALRTDAPEITWATAGEHGGVDVTARAHGFAAAMLISPWTDGAPNPDRALRASSVGVEGGGVRYGPAGIYAGGRASVDALFFGAMGDTTVAIPGPHVIASANAVAGWWRPDVNAWARGGLDLDVASGALSPLASPRRRAALEPAVARRRVGNQLRASRRGRGSRRTRGSSSGPASAA